MITREALEEAIKYCEGQQSPNAATAEKLAAYYTIRNELYPSKPEQPQMPIASGYSYAEPPVRERSTIDYASNTEFGEAVNGRELTPVLEIIDDLMSVLRTAQPRVARSIIENISNI